MGLRDIAREGAYIEVEHGETRYYCRSPLDGVRTRTALEEIEHQESVLLYDGVSTEQEYDHDDEELIMRVLNSPTTQMLQSILGARLVGVRPDGREPKL